MRRGTGFCFFYFFIFLFSYFFVLFCFVFCFVFPFFFGTRASSSGVMFGRANLAVRIGRSCLAARLRDHAPHDHGDRLKSIAAKYKKKQHNIVWSLLDFYFYFYFYFIFYAFFFWSSGSRNSSPHLVTGFNAGLKLAPFSVHPVAIQHGHSSEIYEWLRTRSNVSNFTLERFSRSACM